MYVSSIDIQPSALINTQDLEPTSQDQEQLLEERRKQTFFNPIILQRTCMNDHDVSSHINIEDNSFFSSVKNANCIELKNIFSTELEKFIEITKYFCQDRHVLALKSLIPRVKNTHIQGNINYIKNTFSSCIYNIHDLIVLLENFKYQLEQQNTATTLAISKDTIALRLDTCIVDLDKCLAGISSRLANENEILSSLNQGIAGKINIIKKELFDAILSEYLTQKKQLDQSLFIDGDEIHIRNALHDLMENILGIQKIEDPLEAKELKDKIQEEFIALAQIEISPAKITSILADKFYQQFTKVLADISMESWLTEYKTDSDLIHNLEKLDTNFFIPINTLFHVAEADKLSINSLIDIKVTEPDNYYLNCTKEKIHLWIANRLMPNTTKVFATTTDNLTINTIDYMFFWEYKEGAHDFENDNSNNYVTLQLSHIKNLDFIDFTDVDPLHHKYLSTHIKKTAVSITLVTQAMEQTNNAETIVDFFTDANVNKKINDLLLLKNKLHNILNDKLTNINFRQQFSDAVINLITVKNYEFNQDEIYFLANNFIWLDILTVIIEQNLYNNKLRKLIEINYFNKITTQDLKNFPETTKELLFTIALNNNNCHLIYKLLTISGSNKYTKYNNIVSNKTIFTLAIKYNNAKLVKLLLKDKNFKLKDYNLFENFTEVDDKIFFLYIKHILNSKDKLYEGQKFNLIQAKNKSHCPWLYKALKFGYTEAAKEYIDLVLTNNEFSTEQKLKLIQALDTNYGFPGLYVALEQGHDKTVKDYINLVFSIGDFSIKQKFNLIQAKDKNGFPGLYVALQNSRYKTVKDYINLVFSIKDFSIKQKFELIQAKTKNGFSGLYITLYRGHDKIVSEYMNLILSSDKFTKEQKLDLMQAKSEDNVPGLFAALESGRDTAVSTYINLILANKDFSPEQKFKLIQARGKNGLPGLYAALESGRDTAVSTYINLILSSDKFTTKQKLELIQARGKNGGVTNSWV